MLSDQHLCQTTCEETADESCDGRPSFGLSVCPITHKQQHRNKLQRQTSVCPHESKPVMRGAAFLSPKTKRRERTMLTSMFVFAVSKIVHETLHAF